MDEQNTLLVKYVRNYKLFDVIYCIMWLLETLNYDTDMGDHTDMRK